MLGKHTVHIGLHHLVYNECFRAGFCYEKKCN